MSAPTALTGAANPANPAANPTNPDTPADMETAEAPAKTADTSGKSWIEQMEEEEDLLRVDTNVEETDFGDGAGDSAHDDGALHALLDLDKTTVPQVNSYSYVN